MFSSPAARRLEHLRKSQNTGKASPPVCTRRCSLAKALSKVEARKARLLPTDTPRCDQSHVSSLPIDQPSPLLLAQPASSAGAGLLDISDSMSATESLLSSASCFLATSPLPARSLLIDAEDLRANDAQLDAISSFGASLAETLLQDCRLPSSGQIYGADSAEKDNSGSTSISSSMAEDDELMLAVGIDSLQSPARSNQSVGAVLGRELPGECSVPSPVEANGSLASRLRSLPTPGRSYCKQLSSTTSDPKRSRSTEDAATGTDATRSRDPSAPDVERAAVTRTPTCSSSSSSTAVDRFCSPKPEKGGRRSQEAPKLLFMRGNAGGQDQPGLQPSFVFVDARTKLASSGKGGDELDTCSDFHRDPPGHSINRGKNPSRIHVAREQTRESGSKKYGKVAQQRMSKTASAFMGSGRAALLW